jgi:ribosome biogenesis GTPase
MIMQKTKGQIIKLTGGLYTVESSLGIYECRARGKFRNRNISPVAGDYVDFEDGVITDIYDRKNILLRPPIANIDQLIFVVSTTEPVPNYYVLDQLIAVAESENIEPVMVFTKNDILENQELKQIYKNIGIQVFEVDYKDDNTINAIKDILKGKISAFTGNSGVGKSTLMNAIDENLNIPTNEISTKLGRGKHTTRHTELYHICGGLVADTPGFSAFDIAEYRKIDKSELSLYFREFGDYIGKCKFNDCNHVCEKGCSVIEAVNDNKIPVSRHKNYCIMFNELKKIKDWEKK